MNNADLIIFSSYIRVYDIADPENIQQTGDLAEIIEVDIRAAYDVIPVNGLLILVAKEGLFQFDYMGENLEFVSKIEIVKKRKR